MASKTPPIPKIVNPDFPAVYVETVNYTLGVPRAFRLSKDGTKIFFLRAKSQIDRRQELWLGTFVDSPSRSLIERRLVSTTDLYKVSKHNTKDPEAERHRKERMREAASGITTYSIDDAGSVVAFAIGGNVFVQKTAKGSQLRCHKVGEATDVLVSPNGKRIAYVKKKELFLAHISRNSKWHSIRISPHANATTSWGLPDFIAAEEMERHQGYWWFPDSSGVIYIGVDVSPVERWFISDLANPSSEPTAIRFPRAGTNNANLFARIWRRGEKSVEIVWNRHRYPYIAGLQWKALTPYLVVQSRSQRELVLLQVNNLSGRTRTVYRKTDKRWIELSDGIPSWSQSGSIIDLVDRDRRRLLLGSREASDAKIQVRKFAGELVSGELVYIGSDDPTESHVWISKPVGPDLRLTSEPGVYDAVVAGQTIIVTGSVVATRPARAMAVVVNSASNSTYPFRICARPVSISITPFFKKTRQDIRYAILYPQGFRRDRKLPVIVDPYGGPLVRRCIKSSLSYTVSQWFANQGFAVIVADGRGSPGHNPAWEKSIAGNFVSPVVDDQIAALDHAAASGEFIDTKRVAIRGWSFGGYTAALALLLRPDRFHVAVAGAPVTDWRLYDTHYAERYLGHPRQRGNDYDANSLMQIAHRLERPLLLIHGLNDDNVVSAHTLRFSQILLRHRKQHFVLPLVGNTHMAASAQITSGILVAQLRFIQDGLGL